MADVDRTVVITGASRGLGAGMAEELARQGLRLGLCARSASVLAEGERVVAERIDVVDAGAVERFTSHVVERFGGIDLWINNAGVLDPILPLREIDAEAYRAHLEINVLGVFNGTRSYVRHVRARGGEGVLINISSGAAQNAYAGWSPYCASKAAVDRLTECVALEEADAGLRAYAVSPGLIDTDMQTRIRASSPEDFPRVEKFRQAGREGAFSRPAYVARELLALAFDPARRPTSVIVRLPDEKR